MSGGGEMCTPHHTGGVREESDVDVDVTSQAWPRRWAVSSPHSQPGALRHTRVLIVFGPCVKTILQMTRLKTPSSSTVTVDVGGQHGALHVFTGENVHTGRVYGKNQRPSRAPGAYVRFIFTGRINTSIRIPRRRGTRHTPVFLRKWCL